MAKSPTDLHWNERAEENSDSEKVNIADVTQRNIEYAFIEKHLNQNDRLLEIGCGNGFLTRSLRDQVKFVDAFDQSEWMIKRAQEQVGEANNRFFTDDILQLEDVQPPYDCALCVRVLINLRDLSEQVLAIDNIAKSLKPGGKLILVEGFLDGFDKLNELRNRIGLEGLEPAAINFYSRNSQLMKAIERDFTIEDSFHTGLYDFLTRIVYPTLVGAEQASGHANFHEKIESLAKSFQVEELRPLARVYGYALIRK